MTQGVSFSVLKCHNEQPNLAKSTLSQVLFHPCSTGLYVLSPTQAFLFTVNQCCVMTSLPIP